ncbi:MAG: hypothetical protein U5L02_07925 [Rheinheimera sp.]|nr:hypothetical protein [Rheinheimera sp.]
MNVTTACWLSISYLALSALAQADNAPLRVPHIADAPPFMLTDEQQIPVGGILFDIYQQLARAVKSSDANRSDPTQAGHGFVVAGAAGFLL